MRCSLDLVGAAPFNAARITEAAYLIGRRIGPEAEARVLQPISAGDLTIESLGAENLDRIAELVASYADRPLGGTDASLIALAERLGQTTVATLDHSPLQRDSPDTRHGIQPRT